ncbi:cation-translocating P-type ATPase [Ethanoligenens harbinense]|uniref:P-type Ca(2+) transporter n=1 Tax=Ethanoligenens harbinense (strain DSM 18485 / JCM 12961 / CGMCC 1.5033 / YUAN-3) TaxID=663278 RepID=E6U415_ETHHY|nr:cation-translocating P-type ATPase [Ethanoligenens harbinense]ADU27695.1 ATPase, P-type (transporting), HAD superfamily, subfamily IC [Ethanoligenens harbinense YUAN-3]AVQ96730.1 cation-translocating P-type ATPase [Ethanoligenens harbinense YUAN-3]AYF39390.1 cation-translocating P-type ATPase [Ethanoligenens harbinense]AYF42214.1 cation-translocating P-type ATPase [Ethanoligenens harbinense]QCN92970.1 cation-translocating P-type ATPase [Ethanoligenens harbinense]
MEEAFETLSAEETLQMLSSRSEGLDADEARARLEREGPNVLAGKRGKSPVLVFLSQFNDPLIYILLAAGIISILLHEAADSVIIFIVVAVNAVIGFIQQSRAEKAMEALRKMASPKALVRRSGAVSEIDAAGLVPGDVVVLEAGRLVPADLRLVESANLKIEESALTGESVASEKDADFRAEQSLPVGDRANMAYMTTLVSYGRGEGVVTATGMRTEIGKIAKILEDTGEELTPLQKRLADLGKLLGVAAVALCALLFVTALVQHRNLLEMLLTAISLAVAAIPEGLPTVVTIVLAAGVSRMAKARSIVRRLPAVETLGAVNVVCTDKTGTLTQNRMTVTEQRAGAEMLSPEEADKRTAARFYEGFCLCNDASTKGGAKVGDPTEIALLDMCEKRGKTREGLEETYPRVEEIPFDSDRKRMTTVHDYGAGGSIAYTKGALDGILAHTARILDGGAERPITSEDKALITAAASEMAHRALRVLALACRGRGEQPLEEGMVFVGIVGMIDPPRPEVRDAVAACAHAGITTVMITGDHKDTALAIAKDLRIAQSEDAAISGHELDVMSAEEMQKRVKTLRVFARVSPENKVQIVQAFRANGNIVSMTGDGVNDAPSLKSADIGIAMGITGTDVAKGAADMILTDDNFATIRRAIEEGRNIYNNIKKSVLYLLASNFGEIITMLVAVLAGLPAPLTAAQILWVNLVTDSLPGLALGVDPGTPDVMNEKPRSPKESLFAHGGVAMLLLYGAIIGGASLLGYLVGYREGAAAHGAAYGRILGGTLCVTVLAVSQLFHAIGMRNVNRSVFRMNHLENRFMIFAFFVGLALQVAIVEIPPLNVFFSTAPLDASHWLLALGLSLLPLAAHECIVLGKRMAGARR